MISPAIMNPKNVVDQRPLLRSGATGYVGGRLLQALEAGGHRVRCVARRPEFLGSRVAATTEVVQGDVPRQTRFKCYENQGVARGRESTTRPACA